MMMSLASSRLLVGSQRAAAGTARPATPHPGAHASTHPLRLSSRPLNAANWATPLPSCISSTVAPRPAGVVCSASAGASDGAAKPVGLLEMVKEWFSGAKDREKLASMGMAAFLSYGAISNATYCTCLSIAWIAFVKQRGITPLESGQWAPFLAFYAGLWAVQNIARPARFAAAIAMAPVFDRMLTWLADKTGQDKKVAFGITLFVMACITTTGLFCGIYFFGGLPNGLGPFPPLKRF